MGSRITQWYSDWQNPKHVQHFDFRSSLDIRNLVRSYESFNDVRLLNERLDPRRDFTLVEVGCATGEFYRYLQLKYSNLKYCGVDISAPALSWAKQKYPNASF